jgi:hypothetical protein
MKKVIINNKDYYYICSNDRVDIYNEDLKRIAGWIVVVNLCSIFAIQHIYVRLDIGVIYKVINEVLDNLYNKPVITIQNYTKWPREYDKLNFKPLVSVASSYTNRIRYSKNVNSNNCVFILIRNPNLTKSSAKINKNILEFFEATGKYPDNIQTLYTKSRINIEKTEKFVCINPTDTLTAGRTYEGKKIGNYIHVLNDNKMPVRLLSERFN